LRHHRLLETYLAEALGVPWDEVHAEAEVLEHVLSERLEDRISDLLGDPTADPHGHPIPAKDGSVPTSGGVRLWNVPVGETVAIERVPDTDAEVLRYLAAADITPGAVVEVVGRGPVDGPLLVRAHPDGEPCALSERLARSIGVKEKEKEKEKEKVGQR
jgi:DtxR family Mn-dependent transcriptional regulator